MQPNEQQESAEQTFNPKSNPADPGKRWGYDHRDGKPNWAPGWYKGTIWDVDVKTPKAGGAPMLAVTVKVWNGRQTQLLTDHFTNNQVGISRLGRMAKAFGAQDDFKQDGFQPADYIGQACTLFLTTEESEEHGDGNKVAGYESKDWKPDAKARSSGYAFPDYIERDDAAARRQFVASGAGKGGAAPEEAPF